MTPDPDEVGHDLSAWRPRRNVLTRAGVSSDLVRRCCRASEQAERV